LPANSCLAANHGFSRDRQDLKETIRDVGETQVLIHLIEPVSRNLSDITKTLVGCIQLRFMSLDVGDIRVDNDNTAIARFSFADLIPGAIAALDDDRLARITVLGDTLAYPLFRVLLAAGMRPFLIARRTMLSNLSPISTDEPASCCMNLR